MPFDVGKTDRSINILLIPFLTIRLSIGISNFSLMVVPNYIISYIAFVSVAILISWNMLGPKVSQKIPVNGYKMVWNDEFSDSGLNHAKWNYYEGKRKDAFN